MESSHDENAITPLHPWVANGAHGDQELAQLMRTREEITDELAANGGARHDPDGVIELRQLQDEIQRRKAELGISFE